MIANTHTLYRTAVIMAAKGGTVADIAVGDVLELLDVELDTFARSLRRRSRVLPDSAHHGHLRCQEAPATLRELRGTAGPRTPEELIDRYGLVCRPVRDLLVDYLRERQPSLDYSSMETLACSLGMRFWRDLEIHHPGIDSLRLPDDVSAAWKQRLRTKQKTSSEAENRRQGHRRPPATQPPRVPDPGSGFLSGSGPMGGRRSGALGSVGGYLPHTRKTKSTSKKHRRHRKSRMDARTRERLPILPTLVHAVNQHRKTAEELLHAARRTRPGEQFTAAGQTLVRSVVRNSSVTGKAWAHDPGRREATRPRPGGRTCFLGLGDRGGITCHGNTHRRAARAVAPQFRAIPVAHHR